MMSRTLLSGLLFILTGTAACGATRDRDYGGRRATAWAADLRSPAVSVRVRAADALYHIQPTSSPVVRALLLAMRDSAPEVQTSVAVALGAIGARGVPALMEAVADDHVSVRSLALSILGGQGTDAAPAVPVIVQALGDSVAEVRVAAAFALDRLGAEVVGSVPGVARALVASTADAVPEVRAAAFQALADISADSTLQWQMTRRAFGDTAAVVRTKTVPLLLKARRPARDVTVALEALARDENESVRASAYRAMGALLTTPEASAARQMLVDASHDPSPIVRSAATAVLSPPPPSRIR